MTNNSLQGQNPQGMPSLADSAAALDFLMSAKTAVKGCAFALSEAVSPDVRNVLRTQLDNAINMHEEISKLMISKGWYNPNDLNQQFKMDLQSAQSAVKNINFNLFSSNTSNISNANNLLNTNNTANKSNTGSTSNISNAGNTCGVANQNNS